MIGLIVFLAACSGPEKQPTTLDPASEREALELLLDDYYQGLIKLNPLIATSAGDDRYNDFFPNFLSKAYKDSSKAFFKSVRQRVNAINDSILPRNDRISVEVLKWECDMVLEELSFRRELFPIDQMWSFNLYVGQLATGESIQPFETVEDYDNWLQRMEDFAIWLTTAEARLKEGARIRYILPTSLIIKVVPQLREMVTESAEEHLFYSPIAKLPKSFSKEEKERITMDYKLMIENNLIPAFKSLHTYVSTEYLEQGRSSSGINAIPNGEKYYQFAVRQYTTTDLTADEIHEIGLSEVARIRSEMDSIRQVVGFEGDLKAFFDFVRNSEKLKPFDKPSQVIANFNAINKRMQPQLERMFKTTPKAGFKVKRTEAFRESSASAEYNPGSIDGSRPGVFYVPIPDVKNYNTFGDESLFLHEAIPGHHYQISLAQENDSLPDFRRILWYSSYGEGWALYAESLGEELGLYTDPYQKFGNLSAEIHRAIRLVVDTGLHAKGWTREQAIQYSLDNEAESEESITSEIERYMANPGQALSYKVGQIKILELRSMAQRALGEDFDLREFHDRVLENGCIPLGLLEELILEWIAETKANTNHE